MSGESYAIASPFSTKFIAYSAWTSADFIICSGAVVVDPDNGKILLVRDPKNDQVHLPWARDAKGDASAFLRSPFTQIEEEVGLTLELLPYKKLWRATEEDPNNERPPTRVIQTTTMTTDPFYISFDILWDKPPTSKWYDSKQRTTMWFLTKPVRRDGCATADAVWLSISDAMERLEAQGHLSKFEYLVVRQCYYMWANRT